MLAAEREWTMEKDSLLNSANYIGFSSSRLNNYQRIRLPVSGGTASLQSPAFLLQSLLVSSEAISGHVGDRTGERESEINELAMVSNGEYSDVL